jgi:hypothetical protein
MFILGWCIMLLRFRSCKARPSRAAAANLILDEIAYGNSHDREDQPSRGSRGGDGIDRGPGRLSGRSHRILGWHRVSSLYRSCFAELSPWAPAGTTNPSASTPLSQG